MKLKTNKKLNEGFKINKTLNKDLWDEQDELKEDVKEKLLDITDKFLDNLKEDGLTLDIIDVRLLGSNANYNYNDKSDIDLHIVADLNVKDNLGIMQLLCTFYKSLFNNKYDIKVKGRDVELYIEDVNSPAKSNGVYSLYTGWVNKPVKNDIPIIDFNEFEKQFDEWEDRYFDIVGEHNNELEEDYINDLSKSIAAKTRDFRTNYSTIILDNANDIDNIDIEDMIWKSKNTGNKYKVRVYRGDNYINVTPYRLDKNDKKAINLCYHPINLKTSVILGYDFLDEFIKNYEKSNDCVKHNEILELLDKYNINPKDYSLTSYAGNRDYEFNIIKNIKQKYNVIENVDNSTNNSYNDNRGDNMSNNNIKEDISITIPKGKTIKKNKEDKNKVSSTKVQKGVQGTTFNKNKSTTPYYIDEHGFKVFIPRYDEKTGCIIVTSDMMTKEEWDDWEY